MHLYLIKYLNGLKTLEIIIKSDSVNNARDIFKKIYSNLEIKEISRMK